MRLLRYGRQYGSQLRSVGLSWVKAPVVPAFENASETFAQQVKVRPETAACTCEVKAAVHLQGTAAWHEQT